MTPEWITALATISSTLVAAIAAIFLLKTLRAAEDNNRIITLQLRANRPFLVCEGPKNLDPRRFDSELLSYDLSCNMLWRNFGKPPALNAKFTYRIKSSKDENISLSDILSEVADFPGVTIPETKTETQPFRHSFEIERAEDKIEAIKTPFFSVVAVFKDSHGYTHIVEQGFKAYWIENHDNKYLKLKMVGPDNRETVIETN